MTEAITHIVLFKYRPHITWTQFEEHFSAFTALKTRCLRDGNPYMKSMRMGKNRSWEPCSKGMAHGFVLELASQDDLDYYLTKDEIHAEFSRNAKPLIEDSVVVDGHSRWRSLRRCGTTSIHSGRCPSWLLPLWRDALDCKAR